jgi:lysophospholipase L1-like esterase
MLFRRIAAPALAAVLSLPLVLCAQAVAQPAPAASPAAIVPTPVVPLSPDAAPLPVAIAPNDPSLRYVGRFSVAGSGAAACAWSNSMLQLKFNGTALNVSLSEEGRDFWQVIVDGRPGNILVLQPGPHTYAAATGLSPGDHTVLLVKRTEPMVGTTILTGLQLNDGGKLLPYPPPDPPRRLEVVGDSISCGYGDEGVAHQRFAPSTENSTLTYGALAAKAVGADYMCIAWSGQRMTPGIFITKLYGLTLPKDLTSTWDFSTWVPDVMVINLGANDFAKSKDANPDEATWTAAYEAFIHRVRTDSPNAVIYCAVNPMSSDLFPPGHQARDTLVAYLHKIVGDCNAQGDTKVHFLEFTQQPMDGRGADGHPSLKTHRVMADVLLDALAQDPGWVAPADARPVP